MTLEIEPLELRRPKTGFAAEVMAELSPRYDAMTNHPIVEDVVAGVASMELIRGFTKEFIPIVRGAYRRMSMRLQHCAAHDSELQNALIKEVAEEVFHTPMYYAFCKKPPRRARHSKNAVCGCSRKKLGTVSTIIPSIPH